MKLEAALNRAEVESTAAMNCVVAANVHTMFGAKLAAIHSLNRLGIDGTNRKMAEKIVR